MSNILIYLNQLEQNNNREWYHAHKPEFQKANEDFESLIRSLIFELGKTEPALLHHQPKELTFKIVRDTRYSHDKSPYNPTFRCHISPAGKLPIPVGYYLCVRPGNRSFLGGGLFADVFKDATNMIRSSIDSCPDEFKEIICSPDFPFKVKGTSLKNVPKEFSPDHPMAQYSKYKSWYIEHPIDDSLLENTDQFIAEAVTTFLKMQPFHDFLNHALRNFKMPQR
jgi:uncharacterized protein (TIGR02453 family)